VLKVDYKGSISYRNVKPGHRRRKTVAVVEGAAAAAEVLDSEPAKGSSETSGRGGRGGKSKRGVSLDSKKLTAAAAAAELEASGVGSTEGEMEEQSEEEEEAEDGNNSVDDEAESDDDKDTEVCRIYFVSQNKSLLT